MNEFLVKNWMKLMTDELKCHPHKGGWFHVFLTNKTKCECGDLTNDR